LTSLGAADSGRMPALHVPTALLRVLSFTRKHVGLVLKLLTLLGDLSRLLAGLTGAFGNLARLDANPRAVSKVLPQNGGEICAALRAEVAPRQDKVSAKLVRLQGLPASLTGCDGVVAAVHDQRGPLIWGQAHLGSGCSAVGLVTSASVE
jgi:hypothetical protein